LAVSYPRWLGVGICAAVVAAALSAGQGSGQENPNKATTLRVQVPFKRCVVKVNGQEIEGAKAKTREFAAPALAGGKKEYEVVATWATNNYTRFYRTKKVAPKPGGTVEVDLSTEDKANPDHIEIRYVPTPDDVVRRMCKLGAVGKDDVVFDLGCGDGRLVLTAVGEFKAKRGVGIDLDPERVKDSKENAQRQKLTDKVEFREGDVLKIKDLSDASVVLLYMGDDVNLRLRPILQKTLKPGSRIVSHRFGMGDWMPDKSETFDGEDGGEYTIHLWTIKK
jgi:uncharacterized protein (TIGR03000 family)